MNCARRMVSPKRLGTKYSPFGRYLLRRGRYTSRVTLSFAKIEGIIGDNLPFGALRSREWWSNSSRTGQGQAWLTVGWKVQEVDLDKRSVTLARVVGEKAELSGRRRRRKRRRRRTDVFELPVKPKRRLSPSKTRIAKVQARLRNVERRRSSMRRHRGKVSKGKTRDQYRLWDETAKPTKE